MRIISFVLYVHLDYNLHLAGGTSACLIAGRLIAAEPSLKILLVESGPRTLEDLAHVQPARFATHLQPNSHTVNFMVGNPAVSLAGRSPIVPTGQCLGGGSSVNCEVYRTVTRFSNTNISFSRNVYPRICVGLR